MIEQPSTPSPLARVAATLCVTPIVGFSFTLWGVKQRLAAMSAGGVPDVATASQYIGQALTPAAVSVVLALVGFPLALWCLSKQQRAWWLVSACTFAGMLLLWLVIHGTWLYMSPPATAVR